VARTWVRAGAGDGGGTRARARLSARSAPGVVRAAGALVLVPETRPLESPPATSEVDNFSASDFSRQTISRDEARHRRLTRRCARDRGDHRGARHDHHCLHPVRR
jgi:hypothetical protein